MWKFIQVADVTTETEFITVFIIAGTNFPETEYEFIKKYCKKYFLFEIQKAIHKIIWQTPASRHNAKRWNSVIFGEVTSAK